MASGYIIPIVIDASGTIKGGKDAQRALKKVLGTAGKTDKSVSKMEKSMKRASKAMKAMAIAGAAIAAALIVKTISAATKAYIVQEQAIAQLEAVLRSTGAVAGMTSKQLQDMASAFQNMTTFGDEAIIPMQTLLLTFKNIGGEIFGRATAAVLDMATIMGTDLKSAAIQVGKALNDPIIGMTALTRSGITFSDAQKEMVKDLVKSGKLLEAQEIILVELESQFKDSAKAARNTFGGSLKALGNTWGDLLELIGSGIAGSGLHEWILLIESTLRDLIDNTNDYKAAWIILWNVAEQAVRGFVAEFVSEIATIFGILAKIEAFSNKVRIFGDDQTGVTDAATGLRMLADSLATAKIEADELAQSKIDELLSNSADSASDLAEKLGDAGGELSELAKKIKEQLIINALLKIEVEAATAFQQMLDESLEGVTLDVESVLQDALDRAELDITTRTLVDPDTLTPPGDGTGDAVASAAGGVVQLVQAIDGMADSTKALVAIFANLAATMAKTKATASDWITLVVQIVVALIDVGNRQRKKMVEDMRAISNAMEELRTSLDKLSEVTTEVNARYDDIVEAVELMNFANGELVTKGEAATDTLSELGVFIEDVASKTELLAKVEAQRALELEMATRKVQAEGFSGLIQMFEDLGQYFTDAKSQARFLQELEVLRMELEIINFRIQLDMLRSLGTIAAETLDWIESMINTVEAGLRSGGLVVGGTPDPVRRGGRRPSRGGGTNPRETLQDMLETARNFAGIMEDTFGNMATHFAEMREHVGKMRLSEEERAMRVAEIAELERQASEQYGLTLLERVAQATGDEEMLRDLEAIRFEVERAHTLAQIELLLASGTLSEEMSDRLRQAAQDLANFDPAALGETISDAASEWASIVETTTGSPAATLRKDWERMIEISTEMARNGQLTADEFMKVVDAMRQNAALMALDMIESAARAAGNEDLARQAAEARFNIEKAIQLGEMQVLRATLVIMGGMAEIIAMLDEAMEGLGDLEFDWDPWTGGVGSPGGGIVDAIQDQTDALLAGWQNVIDGLLTGPDSPLSPAQQVDFLQSEYDRLLALARSGDQDAEAQLQQLVPNLVSAMALFTGGTATTAFNDFFAGLMADISMLSGIANPLTGLGIGGGTAGTDNIIGSFRDFQVSAESSADRAHADAEDLKTEFRNMTQRLDLVLAQQGGAGSN